MKKLEPSSSLYLKQEINYQKDRLLLNLGGPFRNLFGALFVKIWGKIFNSTSFELVMHKSHAGTTSKFCLLLLVFLYLASRKQRSWSPPQWKFSLMPPIKRCHELTTGITFWYFEAILKGRYRKYIKMSVR